MYKIIKCKNEEGITVYIKSEDIISYVEDGSNTVCHTGDGEKYHINLETEKLVELIYEKENIIKGTSNADSSKDDHNLGNNKNENGNPLENQ